jgi:PLP dependent protein
MGLRKEVDSIAKGCRQSVTEITDHLADIVERIARTCERVRRPPESVTIVAVSKQQSIDAITAAHRAGLRHFGESYVQEALPKIAALAPLYPTWHFIGRLQANKTRPVAEHFDWVHTVDRARIAERLSAQRPHWAEPLNVLIQVNPGVEAHKGGVLERDVPALATAVAALPRLRLRGLMSMPPRAARDAAAAFAAVAALGERLRGEGFELDTLSMGMSEDFELAVAAGATHVRIGSALFGERRPGCAPIPFRFVGGND